MKSNIKQQYTLRNGKAVLKNNKINCMRMKNVITSNKTSTDAFNVN